MAPTGTKATPESGKVSERIKASVTVLEFVSQFVDLKPTVGEAIGLCPFHDDHHPSFGANDEDNY
jgi:DNA primase